MSYLGIDELKFDKTIVIFEISSLKFVKNQFLANKVTFGIGSVFSKGPVSAFSEGSGPGPFYKVRLILDIDFLSLRICKDILTMVLEIQYH